MKYFIVLALVCSQILIAQEPDLIADYNSGSESAISDFNYKGAVIGNKMILPLINSEHGEEVGIYESGNVTLLKDINPGVESSGAANFISYKSKVYFAAKDAENGNAVWVTDGTTEGTSIFFDLDGTDAFRARTFVVSESGYLYFGYDGHVYRTDGEDVIDFYEGIDLSEDNGQSVNFTKYNGEIAFLDRPSSEMKLYGIESDALVELGSLPAESFTQPTGMAETESGIVFRLKDAFNDDIEGGYFFDSNTGSIEKFTIDGGDPLMIRAMKDKQVVVFVHSQGYYRFNEDQDSELLIASGSGTIFNSGEQILSESLNGSICFVAKTEWLESELTLSDGTSSGTIKLEDIQEYNSNMITNGGSAFFATGTSNGFDPIIYEIDFTLGELKSLYEYELSSTQTRSILLCGIVNNRIIYASNLDGSLGRELYSLQYSPDASTKASEISFDVSATSNGIEIISDKNTHARIKVYRTNGAFVAERIINTNSVETFDLQGAFIVQVYLEDEVGSKMVVWK